ncbi:TPA: restriction endonuclease subunit S [Neisseria bacilliformis]
MAFDIRNTGFKLPSGWQFIRLGDIAKINGKTLTKKSALTDIRYIDISSTSTGKFEEPTLIKIEDAPSRAKRILTNNDIIISTVRPNLKQFAFIEEAGSNLIASTGFCVISADSEKLAWYLYTLITSDIFTAHLVAVADGAAYPAFNPIEIEDAVIALPPENYLDVIVDVTRAIHKKIHLNTQTNQTLEQTAQALYKSWFVDFEPTRAKAAVLAAGGSQEEAETAAMSALSGHPPAALAALARQNPARHQQLATLAAAFPSALVSIDSYGEVPAGWEVKKVGDIAKVIKGKSYKSSELESSKTALVTLKSFNRGGGYRLDGLKEYTGTYKPEQEVFAGDLIIAYTDVTQAADVIGKPAMVMSDNRYEHLIISLDVGVVRPNNSIYKYFLYCMAMTVAFQAHTQSFCTGTTVLHLGKDAVPSFEIAVPNEFLLKKFAEISESIFAKINENIKQSVRLQNVRDTLLPKLLNGELPADTSFQTASEAV